MKKLSKNEEIFAYEYVRNGFVATAAYRVAYPNANENTADKNAYTLMKRPHVVAKINELIEEDLGDLDALATKSLHKLSTIAFAQEGNEYYQSGAQLKALELIQKALGLQTTNIKADVKGVTDIVINITGDTDDDIET